VVVETGSRVSHVRAGDEVLITWLPRSVDDRQPGGVELAVPGLGAASTHNTFTWATHALVDERYVVPTPDGVSADVGSVLGCAVITGAGAVVNTADVLAGETVSVWGLGGVGLCAVAAARESGARIIVAVDVAEEKLALARRFGATHVVDSRVDDPVAVIRSLTEGEFGEAGVDHAIDCVALTQTLSGALASVRPGVRGVRQGGDLTIVGIPHGELTLDPMEFVGREKQMFGSLGGSSLPERDIPRFAEWHLSGRMHLDALISDRFALRDANVAVQALRAGEIRGRAVLEIE